MKNWTEAETALLLEHYPRMTSEAVAEMLGRPLGSVYHKAFRLRLRKSVEYFDEHPRRLPPPSKQRALPDEVVSKVDELKVAGFSGVKIAAALGVHVKTIRNAIARRGTYKDIPADTRMPINSRAGNGGKRRKHVEPALTPDQVRAIKAAISAGARYKVLEREYGVERNTLWRAARGYAPYQGIA